MKRELSMLRGKDKPADMRFYSLGKGEKVAVWATNVPYWVALQFATAKIGAILLTVNTNYKSAELAYLLEQSETENLFLIDGHMDTDYLQTVYDLVPELKQQERGRLHSSRFPKLKRVFFLGMEKHRGLYALPEVMAMAAVTPLSAYEQRQAELDPDDVVNMQYTSGTTGFPKGVMLTHNNIGNNGYWVARNQSFTPADRLCLPVPLFHCFGCVMGVLGAASHGATLVVLEKFDPVQVMASVEQERCTALYGVPSRKYSEEVGAFVIKKPEADLTPEDIGDFCRNRISRHKIPRHIAFVDTYPMTANGKVQKYKLQEMSVDLFPGPDRITVAEMGIVKK